LSSATARAQGGFQASITSARLKSDPLDHRFHRCPPRRHTIIKNPSRNSFETSDASDQDEGGGSVIGAFLLGLWFHTSHGAAAHQATVADAAAEAEIHELDAAAPPTQNPAPAPHGKHPASGAESVIDLICLG